MADEAARMAIILGDGLGDRPEAVLDGLTPAEAANTPTLDRLAAEGISGLMDPIAPGVRAGSDTAHLAILGNDPYKTYTGRGPFEALGIGMEVQRGDICFRCNFATVDEQFMVVDRRAGRIDSGTHELAQALDGMKCGDVTCLFKESVEHRAALILRGPNLGPEVSDVDPHEEGARIHTAEGKDAPSERTAQALNDFVCRSYEILKDHPLNKAREKAGKAPANIVLPRGVGVAPHLEPFEQRYGFSGACIVEVGLIKGLGRYLQMEVPEVPGATGSHDTDEKALADAVLEALGRHPFVLCNMKAPDLSGHDGDPEMKVKDVEKLDRLVERVVKGLRGPVCLAVTGDHSTPCSVKDHSGDPLPIVIWGPGVRTDGAKEFGERPSQTGGLGRIRGHDLMNVLTNLTVRQEKFGA